MQNNRCKVTTQFDGITISLTCWAYTTNPKIEVHLLSLIDSSILFSASDIGLNWSITFNPLWGRLGSSISSIYNSVPWCLIDFLFKLLNVYFNCLYYVMHFSHSSCQALKVLFKFFKHLVLCFVRCSLIYHLNFLFFSWFMLDLAAHKGGSLHRVWNLQN